MTQRSILLLLPLLALACSAGADGKIGVDGAAGADGASGADGAAGTDGADGADGTDDLALITGTLAPGESLTLEHALGAGAYAEAQFTWNGVTYDHRDYSTLRPGHVADGAWFSVPDAEGYRGEVGAAVLASGELAVAQGTQVNDWDEEYLSIDLYAMDGSLVSHIDALGGEDDYLYDPQVVALGDGGFVVAAEVYGYDGASGWYEGVEMWRFDAAGILQAEARWDDTDGVYYYAFDAKPTADGGFVMALGGETYDGDYEYFVEVAFWSPTDGASGFTVADIDDSDVRIAPLPDGRLGVLCERKLGEDMPDGIDYLVVQTDGTIDASTRLQNSYQQEDAAVVVGSQGTVLVAAESGGPDLPFYAVFDLEGAVIQPATGMSGWENDQIQAAAFADGDFLLFVVEDDSNAPMTWAIGAQGELLRPMIVGDITVVPDDDRGAFFEGPGNTLMNLASSYDSETPAYLSTYTKGLLQIRVVSDTEVTLTNETPDTLDVTLAAHGTP